MSTQESREAAARAWGAAGRLTDEALFGALVRACDGGDGRLYTPTGIVWTMGGFAGQWSRWLDANPLPAPAPAMTPEAMIAALEAAGWDVSGVKPPKVGGWVDASAVLGVAEATIRERDAWARVHPDDRSAINNGWIPERVAEALRALGVKPAATP